jgi:hypothetical protein
VTTIILLIPDVMSIHFLHECCVEGKKGRKLSYGVREQSAENI